MDSIFLGVPTRGSIAAGTFKATHQMGMPARVEVEPSSLLTLAFNRLWCKWLNSGIDRFVMLHDDVAPIEPGWLITLSEAYSATTAPVLSAVLPMKDNRGLSSTAFLDATTMRIRRLSMTRAFTLPKIFTAQEAGYHAETVILPNTGLWITQRYHWAENITFTIRDRNEKVSGQWQARCFSEDWDFGWQLFKMGVEVKATTLIPCKHMGECGYPNYLPWGNVIEDIEENYWNPPDRNLDGG